MNPFDQCWDWDEEGRPIGVGTHTGDVVEATFEHVDKPYAIDAARNPTGECLVVTWSKEGYYPIKVRVPKHWRGKVEAICRACGVACPQRGVPWSESVLVGRVATVDVENTVDNQGREYQRVTKWHASPQKALPAEPKKRPARTPAAKAHSDFKEHADADDIPF